MLAVNITVSRDKTTGETINADHEVDGVQERASRWWTIAESTLRDYADEVIAVENNVGEVIVTQLRSRRPRHVSADQGWSLTVDPDGQSATVSGPSPGIAVTAVHDGSVRLVTLPDPEPNR